MTSPVLLLRYTEDVGFDTRLAARYIGNLEDGRSKVSVNSSLRPNGDRADHFRFRVTADGFVRLSTGELVGEDGKGIDVAEEGTVRYQLLSASGRVIADSNPDSLEFEAWQELTSDTNLGLSRGTYTLRVARGGEAVDIKEYVYSFTLRSGPDPIAAGADETASREFLTTERPAPAGATFDQFANVTSVLGLFADVLV